MFLVQSHIVQGKGPTKIVDNVSMGAPSKVTQNTIELTAEPTK